MVGTEEWEHDNIVLVDFGGVRGDCLLSTIFSQIKNTFLLN